MFTVVNALGHVVGRDGGVVRCAGPKPDDCGSIGQRIQGKLDKIAPPAGAPASGPSGNTTLTLVLTNQKLPIWALQRLATQVHMAMGRAIQPYSTTADGDVLFAATTAAVDNPALGPSQANLYLPAQGRALLEPTGPADFRVAAPRGDRLRFERTGNRITGLTINPGHWPISAQRIRPPR